MPISKPQHAVRSDFLPVDEPTSNPKVKNTEKDERSWDRTTTSGVLLGAAHHLHLGNFAYLVLQVVEYSVPKVSCE